MASEMWQRIRIARRYAQISQEKLGNLCAPPVSKSAVAQWESASPQKRTTPKLSNLNTIAQATGAPLNWLLSDDADLHGEWMEARARHHPTSAPTVNDEAATYNASPGPDTRGLVPVISWVKAGAWHDVEDVYLPDESIELLPCPSSHGLRTYALRVEGESMTASHGKSYPAGSVIYVDPDQSGGVVSGDKVIAKINGDSKVTFKVYVEDAGTRFLRPLNTQYPTITDEFRIIGKVIGTWIPE